MQFQEILERKRDSKSLSKAEIQFFVDQYTRGSLPDYQASAFLMASFLNGLSIDETVWLTEAMLYSGIVVDLGTVPGVKVDKHSTGGVGDKTSLIIAPICAALGVPVPMISGRGLGHTGGTLDKLESIPGFSVDLDLEAYTKLVKESGICLIGQTREIAPADKKLYALRDVTCTVESKSLISASIMSKKLAEGIDALVLDVKTGVGAFMKRQEDAEELARLMMSIGKKMGKRVTSIITDMNQPLGSHIGNALEVVESMDILKGKALPEQQDLVDLSILLAAHMVLLGGKTSDLAEAESMVKKTIEDGSAYKKFKEITEKQGGDSTSLDDTSKLPAAKEIEVIKADINGYIESLNALDIGKGSTYLGAGRIALDSVIDSAAGVVMKKKVGDKVTTGESIMEIHFNDAGKLESARSYFENSISISSDIVEPLQLVKNTILEDQI